MKKTKRFVFDTNVIVSAFLFPNSSVANAFEKGINSGTILISKETLEELQEILLSKKFDKYLPKPIRLAFVQKFEIITEMIEVTETINVCRDAKDDKFISLAKEGNASSIITGDKDLLILNPFKINLIDSTQNIYIITPSEFLNL